MNKFLDAAKKIVPVQTRVSVASITILLLVMAMVRLAFMIVNWGTFLRFRATDLAFSFINGARFDLHVIIALCGIFFLLVH
ncbi:hypothetical protein MUP29_14355, partial [bacterium]|nr:hypothetical protein [bacterium]